MQQKEIARNNGRVAILYTFDTLEFSHWKAVGGYSRGRIQGKTLRSKLKNMKILF